MKTRLTPTEVIFNKEDYIELNNTIEELEEKIESLNKILQEYAMIGDNIGKSINDSFEIDNKDEAKSIITSSIPFNIIVAVNTLRGNSPEDRKPLIKIIRK